METIKLNADDWNECIKTATESYKQALRMMALNRELIKLAKKELKKCKE